MSNTTILLSKPPDGSAEIRIVVGSFLASYSSTETRDAYRHDLREWVRWCATHDIHPWRDIRRTHVELYLRQLEERGLANATRGRRLAALRSMFWWLVDEEILEANPAARVKSPRKHKGRRPSLTRPQAADLLVVAERWGGGDAALIKLMLLQGLRVGTVLRIDIDDITTQSWQSVLTVVSKGDKQISTPLTPRTMASVEEAAGDRRSGPLLLNEADRRMTYSNVRYRMRLMCEQAKVPQVSPHALRRTFARVAREEGADLHTIQQAMHHEDPKTTSGYLADDASPYEHPPYNVMTATAR